MFIKHLQINDFRNFTHEEINFFSDINIFHGNNAQGKTNLLEAIYLCGIGRSWRTRVDRELINFDNNTSTIKMSISKDGGTDYININLNRNSKKVIAVNNQKTKRLGDLLGMIYMVIFSPDDLQLIKQGPTERRKFMDIEMCQLSPLYYAHIRRYFHVLKQRNAVLKTATDINTAKETIFLWDLQLVESGNEIIKLRQDFIKSLSEFAYKIHGEITSSKEELVITYKPNILPSDFKTKLENNLERDFFTKTTNSGIHKDDVIFSINGNDVKTFGSQGQIRTTCLSLKLAEIELIHNQTGYNPILLLDDVFSELDENRQQYLMKSITSVQTFITCTGIEDILRKNKGNFNIFSIKNGNISFENSKSVL